MSAAPTIAPGQTWRLFYGKGNPKNCTLHVRGIVDDEEVVFRTWSARKGWCYAVMNMDEFTFHVERGRLTIERAEP